MLFFFFLKGLGPWLSLWERMLSLPCKPACSAFSQATRQKGSLGRRMPTAQLQPGLAPAVRNCGGSRSQNHLLSVTPTAAPQSLCSSTRWNRKRFLLPQLRPGCLHSQARLCAIYTRSKGSFDRARIAADQKGQVQSQELGTLHAVP